MKMNKTTVTEPTKAKNVSKKIKSVETLDGTIQARPTQQDSVPRPTAIRLGSFTNLSYLRHNPTKRYKSKIALKNSNKIKGKILPSNN